MNWNSNTKIYINKIWVIIFAAYSLSLLFGSVFFISPILLGDGHEYLGMTVSFFNHFTPDLREEDIALREQIENKNGINFDKNFTYFGYSKSLGGDWYSYHFWVYPLFNLPVFAFLHYFNFNELRSFQITNSLLLLFSLFILLLITNLTSSQKKWLFLFSGFSPIIFYIRWTHPEVFSYSFVVVAVAFYLKRDFRLAVLASSLASLQNPPIIILTIYIIIYAWKAADLRLRELSLLLGCALISLIPYIFYYSNYRVLSLIVYSGYANISYISFDKIFSLFFDLNFGMLPYTPLLMFLSIFMLIDSIARKDLVIPSLWLVLIMMATISSTQANWNPGMMYINRYSVWMLPIIVLICIYKIPKFLSKNINIYLLLSFVVTLLITGPLLYNYDLGNSVKFNSLSKEVLINIPTFYNPPYLVFAERALGGGIFGPRFADSLPVIFTYNGIPRKALTDYEGLSLIERVTDNPIKKADSEQIKKSKIGYINFENMISKFPYDELKLAFFDKKSVEDLLSANLSISNVIGDAALRAVNGKYVCAEKSGDLPLIANRDAVGPWERFRLIDLRNGKIALQAVNGKFVCAEKSGDLPLIANCNIIGPWETFKLIDLGNNNITLQAVNGKYICAEKSGDLPLIANRDAVGPWETFKLIPP